MTTSRGGWSAGEGARVRRGVAKGARVRRGMTRRGSKAQLAMPDPDSYTGQTGEPGETIVLGRNSGKAPSPDDEKKQRGSAHGPASTGGDDHEARRRIKRTWTGPPRGSRPRNGAMRGRYRG